jgi:hypothetical protein
MTMSEQERNLVPNVPKTDSSILYTKLNELNEKQAEAGYYVALKAGDSVSGVLTEIGQDKFDKANYSIKRADGKTQVVTGQGNLNRQMEGIQIGTYVQITYNGTAVMKTGKWAGKEANNFVVLKESI